MYNILERLSNRKTASSCIVQRARIILLAYQGLLNTQISPIVELGRHAVGRWLAMLIAVERLASFLPNK